MPLKVLKVDSVQLSFDDRKILQDIAVQCAQGEIVGLLGRNGCGKSSLLKIIFGSLRPSYRYVSVGGRFIHNGYADGSIAYLPQQNYLPPNIAIKHLARMLVDPDFWEEFSAHPIYQKCLDSKITRLSGGEVRMLEMLMIVYNRADFILLDEPFTHISPVQTEYFKPVIRSAAKRKGIIVTDHQYYNVIDIADRLFIIENGRTKPVNGEEDLVRYKYLNG